MYTLLDEQLGKVNEHMLEDSTGMRELRGHLYSLQKLLLSLLSKFHMKQPFAVSSNLKRNDHDQYSYGIQICANIMLYARNQVRTKKRKKLKKNIVDRFYLIFKIWFCILFTDATQSNGPENQKRTF